MATIEWIPTSGTNSFNTPANWQGGVVPGVNDIAEFGNDHGYTVSGSATVGEIEVTVDTNVALTGAIATSGTQSNELLVSDAFLTIANGAAVTDNGLAAVT